MSFGKIEDLLPQLWDTSDDPLLELVYDRGRLAVDT
jgi:hypothetical protein